MRSRMIIAVVVLAASLAGCGCSPGGTFPNVDPPKAPSGGSATATPCAPRYRATMNITSGGVARTYLRRIPAGEPRRHETGAGSVRDPRLG